MQLNKLAFFLIIIFILIGCSKKCIKFHGGSITYEYKKISSMVAIKLAQGWIVMDKADYDIVPCTNLPKPVPEYIGIK